MNPLDAFRARIAAMSLKQLHDAIIGHDAVIDGPFGPRPMIYADYVASGRALRPVEEFVMAEVLPWYANSHTEASHCGGTMTRRPLSSWKRTGAACAANVGSSASSGHHSLVTTRPARRQPRIISPPPSTTRSRGMPPVGHAQGW